MRTQVSPHNRQLTRSGFTLVEMMITVAIFAIGFVVIAGIFIGITNAQNRAKGSVEYLNEAQLVFEQIARLVRDNDLDQSSLTCPSTCGDPETYICLKDIANGKTFIRLHEATPTTAGYVEINRGASCDASGWVRLSDTSVNILNLRFESKFPSPTVPDEQAMTTISMRVMGTNTSARGQVPLQLQTAVSSRVFIGTR